MRSFLFLTLLLTCIQATWAGGVEYPAPGNIDLHEGTLEVWITPQAVLYPDPPVDGYQGILSLFNLAVPNHFSFGGSFYTKGKTSALHVSMGHMELKDALIPIPGPGVDWRDSQRQLHHVAMTWKGRDMRLYADGIQVGWRLQAVPFSGDLAGVTFIIGDGRGRDTPLILHAVRTSNIARSAEDLKSAQPTVDLHTLMLDRFNDSGLAGDGSQLPADLISGFSGETGGTLVGHWEPVTAEFPGIALFRQKTESGQKE